MSLESILANKRIETLEKERSFFKKQVKTLKRERESPSKLFDLLLDLESNEDVKNEVKRRGLVCEWHSSDGKFCSAYADVLLPRPQMLVCEAHREEFLNKAKQVKDELL